MYAIAFDLEIAKVKINYGEPYNPAYDEIKKELDAAGFAWTQGSVYLSREGANLATVYKAIDRLRKIQWFRDSVRDLRAFKVEDWSDFTEIVRTAA
jgi:virulence-associated protein VapD